MRPPKERLDASAVFAAELEWSADPDAFLWMRARFSEEEVFVRINTTFPDEHAYSLLIDADETVEFDDIPENWTRVDRLEWPDTARREPG